MTVRAGRVKARQRKQPITHEPDTFVSGKRHVDGGHRGGFRNERGRPEHRLDRELRPLSLPDEAAVLRDAIHEFFRHRAESYRHRLRELFRVGRTSLMIGLAVLAAAIALGDFLASLMKGSRIGEILRESLTIGGWVSMWRPLEVFLYDWWPIRNERRIYDRLSSAAVRINCSGRQDAERPRPDLSATVAPAPR